MVEVVDDDRWHILDSRAEREGGRTASEELQD